MQHSHRGKNPENKVLWLTPGSKVICLSNEEIREFLSTTLKKRSRTQKRRLDELNIPIPNRNEFIASL